MTPLLMTGRDLPRARPSRPRRDLLEQGVFDLVQVNAHQLMRLFRILALDRLKNFSVVPQYRKSALRNALDAPLEHELLTGIVQYTADRMVPAICATVR